MAKKIEHIRTTYNFTDGWTATVTKERGDKETTNRVRIYRPNGSVALAYSTRQPSPSWIAREIIPSLIKETPIPNHLIGDQ